MAFDEDDPDVVPVGTTETAKSPPAAAPVAFDDLFGGISGDVTKGLGEIKRKEAANNERIIARSEGQVAQDRTIAQRHYDAAGIEAEKLTPWNAKQEYEQIATSPMDAFGSFASVFAIVASAFTRAPLENALNASAAAMTAIKKGDDQTYERGHTAWKENMDLFKKRFDMQNVLYKDALDLMTHDQSAGRVALQNAAVKFGDQKALFLLENGLDKDLIDLNTSRIRQADAITQARDKMTESTFRRQAFDSLKEDFTQRNGREPNPNETVQIWNYSHGIKEPWQQQLMQQFLINHQGEPDVEQKAATYAQSLTAIGRGGSVENQWLSRWRADFIAKNGDNPTPEQETEALKLFHDARRKEDLKTDGIKEIQDKAEKAGAPISTAEATRQFNLASSVRGFSESEKRYLPAVPTAMSHLQTLDWFANQTGPIKFIPAHIAAVYGGLNDPQQIYEAALRGAKTSVIELGAGGTQLKKALEARLERLPGNFQDPRFNKRLTQGLMQDIANEARSKIDLLEQSGKTLPESVREEYAKWGIYPRSAKDKDPVYLLRNSPQALSKEQITNDLVRVMSTLSIEDQQKLRAEIIRRKALESAPAPP